MLTSRLSACESSMPATVENTPYQIILGVFSRAIRRKLFYLAPAREARRFIRVFLAASTFCGTGKSYMKIINIKSYEIKI